MIQEFVKNYPLISIMLFSLVITVISTLSQKYFTNQIKMKEVRTRSKEIQDKMKLHRNDIKKVNELNEELMKLSTESMKESFKLMFITLIPFLIIFKLLRDLYMNAEVGDIIYWGANVPMFGQGAGWLLSYIIFSIIFSMILRKFLKVY